MTDRKDSTRKPFFARFLEVQELEKVTGGRRPAQTQKYPSDRDETAETMKYPSDSDEESSGS